MTTNLAEIIKNKRKSKGLSMERLAQKASVSFKTIYNIEGGEYMPTLNVLSAICDALELEFTIIDKEGDVCGS